MKASGKTTIFALLSPASSINLIAFLTPFSLSITSDPACTTAALNLFILVKIIIPSFKALTQLFPLQQKTNTNKVFMITHKEYSVTYRKPLKESVPSVLATIPKGRSSKHQNTLFIPKHFRLILH